ncbi:TonB-dependent siderophore receptor [Ralstonia pickettii]|uniref:TonB-dependent siderophore receptor n=1 Tax=Ralstonia pickettii TaxID=329 RepID=A0A2N4TSB6_RALPI|nr:TonB-dependent receptor [Ralstonia pickettii]PLC42529.1 TonB-dependent siderophore receptor [Ralstonia pickettii]
MRAAALPPVSRRSINRLRPTPLVRRLALVFAAMGAGASAYAQQSTTQVDLPATQVTAGKSAAYGAKQASTGALGDKAVLDTPFTINVATQELIQNRQAQTIGEVFKGDPAVTANNDGYIGEASNITIRGLQLDLLEGYKVDGLAVPNWGSDVPLEHFERVELLKGLSGFMYGFGTPGGIANFVTKRPTNTFGGSATFGFTSGGTLKESLDVGARVGPTKALGARLGVVHEEGDTFVDGGHIKRDSASLALDARITPDLQWSFDGLYMQRNVQGAYYGIIPGQDFGVPVTEFVRTPRAIDGSQRVSSRGSYYETEIKSVGTELNWAATPDWNVRAAYRYTQQNRGNADSAIQLTDNAGNFSELQYSSYQRYQYSQAQVMANGKVRTGPIEHELVFGTSWQSLTQATGGFASTLLGTGNLYDTSAFVSSGATPMRVPSSDGLARTSRIDQTSVFASDTAKFNEHWSVLGGLRYTRFNQTGYNTDGSTSAKYTREPITPTLAVMFKPVQPVTLYTSYVESLEAGATAPITALNAGTVFGPLKSKQIEVGAKAELHDWTFGAALFQVQRGLAYLRPDNVYTQDGMTRYRGLELSARGKLARDWTLLGGVLFMNSENTESDASVLGKRAYGSPRFKATAYVEYAVPPVPGLVLSAGGQYVGNAALEADNSNIVPGYHTFDVGARYSTKVGGKPVTLRFNVDNLTNEKYWLPSWGFILVQGAPRTFRASATVYF